MRTTNSQAGNKAKSLRFPKRCMYEMAHKEFEQKITATKPHHDACYVSTRTRMCVINCQVHRLSRSGSLTAEIIEQY